MATQQTVVKVTRWTGSKHPTLSTITRMMNEQGLRPYRWDTNPNQRLAVRTHGFDKVLYVIEGTMEISLPDSNQRVRLRAGDRIDIPAKTRHASLTGESGATCLEAAKR